MEFDYTTTTRKKFDEAVHGVQEEIARSGMKVLHVHDVQKTLNEKGFEREPFKIIEFCNAKYADAFLSAATHWAPLSSLVVLADFTAPPATTAIATAATLSSSGASNRITMSLSPKQNPPPTNFPPTASIMGRAAVSSRSWGFLICAAMDSPVYDNS